jgi:transposase-like protein
MTYHALVAEFKRRLLAHALACGGGSVVKAARLLGVDPKTFYRTRSRLRAGSRQGPVHRCATCAHSVKSHRTRWHRPECEKGENCLCKFDLGCTVPRCLCERYLRAVPASATQHPDEHRPPAGTGRQAPRE